MKYKITFRKTITDPIETKRRLNEFWKIFEPKNDTKVTENKQLDPSIFQPAYDLFLKWAREQEEEASEEKPLP